VVNEKKVLVIDDEVNINKVVCEKLKDEGHESLGVYNGKDGLEAISTFKPDVVWLDLKLPDMDGMEVLSQIRKNEATKGLPVMIVTNVADPQMLYKSSDLTRYYFTKAGWELDDLIKEIVDSLPDHVSNINTSNEDRQTMKKA